MQSHNQNLIKCIYQLVFDKMKIVVIITDVEMSTCAVWFRLPNKPQISFYQNLKQQATTNMTGPLKILEYFASQ